MKTREINKEDYNTLTEWWGFWRFPSPPFEVLPSTGLVITDDEDNMLCAGYLYHTNSTIAWIEWIVANPKQSKESREQSIIKLLNELKYLCKQNNYLFAFSSIKNQNLLNKYIDCGWQITSKNSNEMMLNLWQ